MNTAIVQLLQSLPSSTRQPRRRRWLTVALALGLPLSTIGPTIASGIPGADAASPGSSTSYSETFQSTGQSAFPASVTTGQITLPIIPQTNFGGSFNIGEMKGGYGVTASFNGNGDLGLSAGIRGFLGEKVNVSYPLQASFDVVPTAGGSTTIRTSWTPQPGGLLAMSGSGLSMTLNAQFGLTASASAQGCAASICTSNGTSVNLPTETYQIFSNSLNGGSAMLPLGISGSVGGQTTQTTTSLEANNALTTTSSTPLDTIQDDAIDTVVEALTGVPASIDFSGGQLSANLTGVAGGMTHTGSLNNDFSFLPRPWTTLEFSAPVRFSVFRPDGTPDSATYPGPSTPVVASSGTAATLTFPLGDNLTLTSPGATELTATPILGIDNTFTNATSASSTGSYSFTALGASVSAYGYSASHGPLYTATAPSFGCPNYPLVQALEVAVVPLSTCTVPSVSDSWTLAGFSSRTEAPFTVAIAGSGTA